MTGNVFLEYPRAARVLSLSLSLSPTGLSAPWYEYPYWAIHESNAGSFAAGHDADCVCVEVADCVCVALAVLVAVFVRDCVAVFVEVVDGVVVDECDAEWVRDNVGVREYVRDDVDVGEREIEVVAVAVTVTVLVKERVPVDVRVFEGETVAVAVTVRVLVIECVLEPEREDVAEGVFVEECVAVRLLVAEVVTERDLVNVAVLEVVEGLVVVRVRVFEAVLVLVAGFAAALLTAVARSSCGRVEEEELEWEVRPYTLGGAHSVLADRVSFAICIRELRQTRHQEDEKELA